jgi:hypothetical protein
MSIIRSPRPDSNFYILDKSISEDETLSWAARGLLVFLLGKPDNWRISVEHLKRQTQESAKPTGRDGIYSLLMELMNAGYIRRTAARDELGKMAGYDYFVSETRLFDSPRRTEPITDSPCPAEPYTAGTTLISIEDKQEQKETNSCDRQAESRKTIPFDEIFQAYADNLPTLPQIRIKDEARKRAIRSIWNLSDKFQTVDFFERYYRHIGKSEFLMGMKAIGFDWLMKPANFKKVIEGNYHNA